MSCPLSRPLSPPVPSPPGGSTAPWLPLYRTAHSPKGEGTRPRAGTSVIHPQEEPGSLQELENCLSNGGLSPQQHGSRVFLGGGVGGASPCALVVKNTGAGGRNMLWPPRKPPDCGVRVPRSPHSLFLGRRLGTCPSLCFGCGLGWRRWARTRGYDRSRGGQWKPQVPSPRHSRGMITVGARR